MDTLRLVIADGSEELCAALADALRGAYHVRTSQEGNETLELLRSFTPELLILDLMLPGLDGISLLQRSAAAGIRPIVLATTRFSNQYVLDMALKLGVGYVMVKPCDVRAIVARVADLSHNLKMPLFSKPEPRVSVSNLLLTLGIPTKLRGYGCLREAVLIMARDPDQSVTKELYPAVAAQCGGTAVQVERAIRSAIHIAWEKRDDQLWRLYFQLGSDGTVPRPTNAAFISRLADVMTLNRERGREQL